MCRRSSRLFQSALATTTLLLTWALILIRSLRFGRALLRAIFLATRLAFFGVCLSPAVLYYLPRYLSAHVSRGIAYGPSRRNTCDLYTPPPHAQSWGGRRPVVLVCSGGAWIIGHKTFSLLQCMQLADAGCIAVAIDIRQIPQTDIAGMLVDLDAGMDAVVGRAVGFPELAAAVVAAGGDAANRLFIFGHSAGAHIACISLLERAICDTLAGTPAGGEAPRSPPRRRGSVVRLLRTRNDDVQDEPASLPPTLRRRPTGSTSQLDTLMEEEGAPVTVRAYPAGSGIAYVETPPRPLPTPPAAPPPPPTPVVRVRRAFLASCPFNVAGPGNIKSSFVAHLGATATSALFGGAFRGDESRFSPTLWLQRTSAAFLGGDTTHPPLDAARLAPMTIMHGGSDRTVPIAAASEFRAALLAAGVPAASVRYTVWRRGSHTDCVLEGPCEGSTVLIHEVLGGIGRELGVEVEVERGEAGRRLVPRVLVWLSRWVNPF